MSPLKLPLPTVESRIDYSFDKWKEINSDKINEMINITVNHLKNSKTNKIEIHNYKQLTDEIIKLLYRTSINTKKKYITY